VRPAWGREAMVMGASGVALLFVFHNLGLRLTSAGNGTLVMNGGYPVLAGVLAAAVLGERWGGRLLVGTLASAAGVAATVLGGGGAGSILGGASWLGDGLILASAASAAVYAVVGRRVFAAGGPGLLAVLAGSTGYGLLMLLPGAVGEVAVSGLPQLSGRDVLLVLYLGAGCSALAYALWGFALRHLATGETAVVGNLELVIGVGAAALLLGEPLTGGQVVGGALILAGAWLAASGAGAEPVPLVAIEAAALAPVPAAERPAA
jgi:drug/metabolite transporter (DMT)-like permease